MGTGKVASVVFTAASASRYISSASKMAKVEVPNSVGKTVLGKYPGYVNLSNELAARRFEIPSDIWNKMTPGERWNANQKFLDRTIAKQDEIVLANPVNNINQVDGYYRKELEYLIEKGYKLNPKGNKLVK